MITRKATAVISVTYSQYSVTSDDSQELSLNAHQKNFSLRKKRARERKRERKKEKSERKRERTTKVSFWLWKALLVLIVLLRGEEKGASACRNDCASNIFVGKKKGFLACHGRALEAALDDFEVWWKSVKCMHALPGLLFCHSLLGRVVLTTNTNAENVNLTGLFVRTNLL